MNGKPTEPIDIVRVKSLTNRTMRETNLHKLVRLNIFAIGFLAILAFIGLMETPLLAGLRTETMLGLILLVFMPLAILLALVQLYLWLRWFTRTASPEMKKSIQLVFLAALSVFALFIILRWTV